MVALGVSACFGVAAGNLMNAFAFTPVLLAFAVVGAIVASYRPVNPIGWLFQAEGLGFAAGLATDTLTHAIRAGQHRQRRPGWPGPVPSWASSGPVRAGAPGVPGRPAAVPPLAGSGLDHHRGGSAPGAHGRHVRGGPAGPELRRPRSPVRLIPDSVADPVLNVLQTALPLAVVAAAGLPCGTGGRPRTCGIRSSGRVRRCGYRIRGSSPASCSATRWSPCSLGPFIPVAAGIAIFRYRLYDIDVVISKTIVYGSLAAFITLVYVVIVAGSAPWARASLAGTGSRPNLGLSILATAVVAVGFQPLRERVQRVANRLVYGQRATPYEALSQFAGQMGGTYATEEALPRMGQDPGRGDRRRPGRCVAAPRRRAPGRRVLAPGRRPARRSGSGPRTARRAGSPAPTGSRPSGTRAKCSARCRWPSVAVSPLTPTEGKLIGDLAAQAGLLLRNVGLTEQLSERLDELRADRGCGS